MRKLPYLASTAALTAVFLAMATHSFALDTDIYLSASNSTAVHTSLQNLNTSLDLDATASTEGESSHDETSSSQTASQHEDDSQRASEDYGPTQANVKGFLDSILSFFVSLGLTASTTSSTTLSLNDLASAHAQDVEATHVTIVLPHPDTHAVVYYGTTTPVVIASSTAHATVSLWKFWKHDQIELEGLSANTMYFYRIADGSNLTSEASFKTAAH